MNTLELSIFNENEIFCTGFSGYVDLLDTISLQGLLQTLSDIFFGLKVHN